MDQPGVAKRCQRCGDEVGGPRRDVRRWRFLCDHCVIVVPYLRALGFSDKQIHRMGEYDPPVTEHIRIQPRYCLKDAIDRRLVV